MATVVLYHQGDTAITCASLQYRIQHQVMVSHGLSYLGRQSREFDHSGKPENQQDTYTCIPDLPLVWRVTTSDNILLLDTDLNCIYSEVIIYPLTLKLAEQ